MSPQRGVAVGGNGVKPTRRIAVRKPFWLLTLSALLLCAGPVFAQTGNLAPAGPHYELNIIGVDQTKKPQLVGTNRHVIYVPLVTAGFGGPGSGQDTDPVPGNDIWLVQGADFTVCDGNAFDRAWNCDGSPVYIPGTKTQ